MSLLLCMLLLLILFQMRKQEDNYMEKEQCNGIKGIFIVLVFIRHVLQYITKAEADLCTLWDAPCLLVDHLLGQLIVALFLFYSGFGVMESFKQKGSSYVSSMPRKRIIGTLLNFDVAVLCFVLVDLCLGVEITWKQTILSFVAWDSVGNSNWYIFTILLCYTLSYGIFRLGLFNESGHRHVWVIGGG